MKLERIIMVLLASGLSRRFGHDKLMTTYRGAPLVKAAASKLAGDNVAARLAIVGAGQSDRKEALEALGWTLVCNPDPEAGQGHALACAANTARQYDADGMMVLLADMPCIPEAHLYKLAAAMALETEAVMSVSDGVQMPPALFSTETLTDLSCLSGDRGARSLFDQLQKTITVPLDPRHAIDIDTAEDLAALEGHQHA